MIPGLEPEVAPIQKLLETVGEHQEGEDGFCEGNPTLLFALSAAFFVINSLRLALQAVRSV